MTALVQATDRIQQGENVLVRAQLLTESGLALTDDGASGTQTATAASVYVYDVTDPTAPATLVNEGSSSVVTAFNVGQCFTSGASPWATAGWKLGGSGFNAGFTIVHSDADVPTPTVPTVQFKGGRTYRCEFLVTHGGGVVPGLTDGPIHFVVVVHVDSTYSRSV